MLSIEAVRKKPPSTDVMTVESTGERTFFHHRGANAELGSEHFDFSKSMQICRMNYMVR